MAGAAASPALAGGAAGAAPVAAAQPAQRRTRLVVGGLVGAEGPRLGEAQWRRWRPSRRGKNPDHAACDLAGIVLTPASRWPGRHGGGPGGTAVAPARVVAAAPWFF